MSTSDTLHTKISDNLNRLVYFVYLLYHYEIRRLLGVMAHKMCPSYG